MVFNRRKSTMKNVTVTLLFVLVLVLLNGCASKPPTIAHTHIGHVMTGWRDTPGQAGLFVVAENKANEALQFANNASKAKGDLSAIKKNILESIAATDVPTAHKEYEASHSHKSYGVKQALTGAVDHIKFAANSDDASQNVKTSVEEFAKNANAVLGRCDIISTLGNDIQSSNSLEEANILTQEVLQLVEANLNGVDANNNGIKGDQPDEYGIIDLRQQLQAMIARENPPYTTVDTWYLFNLIRLPSGKWMFQESSQGGYGSY